MKKITRLYFLFLLAIALSATPPMNVAAETMTFGCTEADFYTGIMLPACNAFISYDIGSSDDFFGTFQPPPTAAKTIESINFLIVRTGSYTGSFTLTFEVRDFLGNIQR